MQAALPTPGSRRVILDERQRVLARPIRFAFGPGALGALLAIVAACSSPPPPPKLTPAQRVERDERIGSGLATRFEADLQFKEDRAVDAYLRGLWSGLASSGQAEGTPATVAARAFIYRPADGKWAFFALPFQRVYVPAPYLKEVEFESELAAALALQAAHLQLEHVILHLTSSDGTPDFRGEAGLFSFDEKEVLAATEQACGILYRGGYDGRGLIAFLERFRDRPALSPYAPERLEKMIELARRTIALSSPLRNPIVRSPAFMAIQKRMRRL